MMSNVMLKHVLKDKIEGSLLGFYVGDSLAMPVHWYYDLSQLRRDFGLVSKYEAPKVSTYSKIVILNLLIAFCDYSQVFLAL